MIVSHKCKFILFSDPLGAGANVMHALSPWSDEIIAAGPDNKQDRMFFHGMTPTEAEWAFDASGLEVDSTCPRRSVQNVNVLGFPQGCVNWYLESQGTSVRQPGMFNKVKQ